MNCLENRYLRLLFTRCHLSTLSVCHRFSPGAVNLIFLHIYALTPGLGRVFRLTLVCYYLERSLC